MAKPEPVPPYVIEGILPSRQLHLIGGASGSGKTRFSFQMISSLVKGEEFLGHATLPVRLGYISGDRAARSVKDTQKDMGVNFPVYSLVDTNQICGNLMGSIIPALPKFYGYRPNFIYIDGFTSLCPGGKINDYLTVAEWLASLQRYCDLVGVTILGACHTAKTKQNESYTDPRQKLAGSVAWAAYSDTVILIEEHDDKNPAARRVTMLPRNGKKDQIVMTFDDTGHLVLPESITMEKEIAGIILGGLLQPGKSIEYRGFVTVGKKGGLSTRTVDRWLAKQVETGKLERRDRGDYYVLEGEKV